MNNPIKISTIVIAGILFLICWLVLIPTRQFSAFAVHPAPVDPLQGERFASSWVSANQTTETHSASLTINNQTPTTVWYGGSEEGASDVALFINTFEDNQWQTPSAFMDREKSEQSLDRYIRKVGNPVVHAWPDGSLTVYFVTVSIGGWGGSALNYMESSDGGNQWSKAQRLVSSPFLNISTLVRTRPVTMADGSIYLPVYHEFLGKFAEVLHLDRAQNVLNKIRITRGTEALQPAIAVTDEQNAIAALRYAGTSPGRVHITRTMDAGHHWHHPAPLDLANPNAAVSLLNLRDGRLLLALNDLEDGRHRLSLAIADEDQPENWQLIRVLEEESGQLDGRDFEFSYPSMTMDEAGEIHMVYTWNQTRIRHIRFNRNWLESSESRLSDPDSK